MSRRDDLVRAVAPVAPIPRGEDGGPVFQEPWEAQVFAMTLLLHERGVFLWSEWTQALGAEIDRPEAADDRHGAYYRHWLAAIERLVSEKGLSTAAALEGRRAALSRAAHATPHGSPIRLDNDPLRSP